MTSASTAPQARRALADRRPCPRRPGRRRPRPRSPRRRCARRGTGWRPTCRVRRSRREPPARSCRCSLCFACIVSVDPSGRGARRIDACRVSSGRGPAGKLRGQVAAGRAGGRPVSRATTRIVSSPAIVPTTSGRPERSSALARNCAAPGGVRSTTRLPLESAPVSSSRSSRCRRAGVSSAGRSAGVAVLRDQVARRAVGAAHLHRAQLLQVARERRLGDLDAVGGEQVGELGLRADRPRRGSASRCGRAGRPSCIGTGHARRTY